MKDYDFLGIYFPAASELSDVRMRQMRSAVGTLVRSVYPDVDTSPNSPFGDLFVSPAAPALASDEVAVNRLFSDLDPENVANGVAYNCDFIRDFYLNFGIQDESTQRSYGVLRLIFSSSEEREIDRSTTFQLSAGSIYRPFVPQAGPLFLLPPGQSGLSGTNFRNYTFYSEGSWVVDILVMGNAGQLGEAGGSVSVDRVIDGLTSAVALSDFKGGTTPPRLQDLARRVRYNFYSRTPTTRGGATNLIHQQFPEINITGCTVSGDAEMMRDVTNPGQVAAGNLDLMARSVELLEDTVVVRLRQTTGPGGDIIYGGKLLLPETPIMLLSVKNDVLEVSPDIYSVSRDSKAPALTAAYGTSEELYVKINYGEDSLGNPAIRAEIDEEGIYADFAVTYLFDPALKICQEFMLSDSNVPAGLDIYVRWFMPVIVDSMVVDFNRKAGTTLNLEDARENILTSFNSHRFEEPAGAALVDSAFYYAGAHSVNNVDIIANIRYSIASQVFTGMTFVEPVDQASWEAFILECEDVPVIPVNTVYNPAFDYTDYSGTLASSGPRNVSYLLSSTNLKLVERRSV